MLQKTACSITYQGGGGLSVFPITFPFLETGHIEASLRDAAGNAAPLAAGTDFTVNRISDAYGELILLGPPPPEGTELTISRRVPLTQEIMFHNQGPSSPQAIEETADKLTMIAQQLQADLDSRVAVPEGFSADEAAAVLLETKPALAALGGRVGRLAEETAGKADAGHTHSLAGVSGLETVLLEKAARQHIHVRGEIAGLTEALAGKADADDPRFGNSGAAAVHAARHAAGGEDPLSPSDIGTLPLPPADGKRYLAMAGGWSEYVPESGSGGDEGGTTDHTLLENREAPDQHPQSAVSGLSGDLEAIRTRLAALDAAALPANGTAGSVLARNAEGRAVWVTPDTAAAALPVMAPGRRGTAALSETGGLEVGAGGELGLAPAYRVTREELEAAAAELAALSARLRGMAEIDDAPADGKTYCRKDGAWQEFTASSGGGSGAILGEIRLLPFRSTELPGGWYFCNGDRYLLSSAQGAVLTSLSETFREDWGITASDGAVSLPSLFGDGGGYFLRPADNAERFPGSRQTDAIRNITGTFATGEGVGALLQGGQSDGFAEGAFRADEEALKLCLQPDMIFSSTGHRLVFDASGSVPTAGENRPANIGMTPAIYMGV